MPNFDKVRTKKELHYTTAANCTVGYCDILILIYTFLHNGLAWARNRLENISKYYKFTKIKKAIIPINHKVND